MCQRSLTLLRELGDRFNEADNLVNLGDVRHAVGDGRAARAAWEAAGRILEEFHPPTPNDVRAR